MWKCFQSGEGVGAFSLIIKLRVIFGNLMLVTVLVRVLRLRAGSHLDWAPDLGAGAVTADSGRSRAPQPTRGQDPGHVTTQQPISSEYRQHRQRLEPGGVTKIGKAACVWRTCIDTTEHDSERWSENIFLCSSTLEFPEKLKVVRSWNLKHFEDNW